MYGRQKPGIRELRKALVDDSIEREKQMTRLLKMVREDERRKVLEALAAEQAKAERDRG